MYNQAGILVHPSLVAHIPSMTNILLVHGSDDDVSSQRVLVEKSRIGFYLCALTHEFDIDTAAGRPCERHWRTADSSFARQDSSPHYHQCRSQLQKALQRGLSGGGALLLGRGKKSRVVSTYLAQLEGVGSCYWRRPEL